MNTDFSSLDKSDFKCLRTPDGAIYYGQCVQILHPGVETENLAGFHEREETKKPRAPPLTSGSSLSGGDNASAKLANSTHGSAVGFRLGTADKKGEDALSVLH